MFAGGRSTTGCCAALGLALLLPALATAAERARPRVCVVSVSLPEGSSEAASAALRKSLEQSLERERGVVLVPHARYAELAQSRGLPPDQWSAAATLAELGSTLELTSALLVVVAPHGSQFRVLVAAVDPLDGGQMATASALLPAPRLERKRARAVTSPLVRSLLEWIATEEASPPPPPPPAAATP